MRLMFRRSKKSKQSTTSARVSHRKSLPVDRYYSSSTSKRTSNVGGDKRNADSKRNRGTTPSFVSLLQKGFRWAGVIGIVIVLALNVLLSSVGVKVNGVDNAVNQQYRSNAEYMQTVSDVFSQSFFNKSKATFNSRAFERRILEELPEVKSATAVVPLAGTKLQVGLELSSPLVRVMLARQKQGIISESGVLVSESDAAHMLSTYSSLPLLVLEPGVGATVGEQLLTGDEVELFESLVLEFNGSDKNRPTVDTVTYDIEKRELQVRFRATAYYAKMTSERAARAQVGALAATIADLVRTGQEPPTQYIDVRVEGRVFVR